jgi:hypothetical protein
VVELFEDDIVDERAEVEKKVEDGDVVVVEGGRNGITMAGLEATEGLDVGLGAATDKWSITGADVDACRGTWLSSLPGYLVDTVLGSKANAIVIHMTKMKVVHL